MARVITSSMALGGALLLLWLVLSITAPQGKGATDIIFVVTPGDSFGRVIDNLEEADILKATSAFKLWAGFTGLPKHVQTGEYHIPAHVSVMKLVQALRHGLLLAPDTVFTVIEGWNLRDIGFAFERAGLAQAEEFWELAGFPAVADYHTTDLPAPYAFAAEFEFLQDRPRGAGLEGYLFPDTYHFPKGQSVHESIRMMLKNFDQKVSPALRREIVQAGHSLHEIMVVASLIEREVREPQDRAKVSDIIWRRLGAGMPLQLDATINYITGGNAAAVLLKDTQLDSPYNTYRYAGLPPAPISNPGLETIYAALNPASNDFWYYLSAPSGTTIFSRNFAEHVGAKVKYLR